jgi:hypothetical protein
LRREVRPTDPAYRPDDDRPGNVWAPLVLAAAILVGIGYFILAAPTQSPAPVKADSGAVTKSEPSPN